MAEKKRKRGNPFEAAMKVKVLKPDPFAREQGAELEKELKKPKAK